MDVNLGLVLAIAAGLLVVAGGLAVVLGLGLSRLVPLPPLPEEEAAPAEPLDEALLAARRAAYRQGIFVLVGLAVLTGLEFLVASFLGGSVVFLFVIALVKAGLILQYFMHLGTLWSEEAHR